MGLNVKFYCRECKAGKKDGLAPVEVSIIVDGARKIVTLPRKENPKEFKQALASKRDNDIKRYVEATRRSIGEYVTSLTERREILTVDALARYVRKGGVETYTLEDVFNEFIGLQRKRVGVTCGEGQFRKYELAFERLCKDVDRNVAINNVRRGDIENHIAELGKTMAQASVAAEVIRLRALFKYAFDCGYLKSNPFAMIRQLKPRPREEWLTDEEIGRIRRLKGLTEEVETSRKLFLFQCATGLSYADMMRLKPNEITCENGVYSVAKTRTKTGIRYTSVVLPEGVQILKEWNFEIPQKSNQKYNLGLLKIEVLTGLGKHLHSHLGRKVYGSTLLRGGVSMKAVSKALGHSNTSITESTYAFLQSKDVINEITKCMGLE